MSRSSRKPPSFDRVADTYDRVRPGYPDETVDDLLSLGHVPPGGRILEIGAGTGQLTVSLAERGYEITAVEMGLALASRCAENLAEYRHAAVLAERFEDADLAAESFDLVAAATSFHWLDPAVAYAKAARVLRPGGHLGLLWNLHVGSAEGFFAAADEVYARYAPHLVGPSRMRHFSQRAERMRDIEATGLFTDAESRTYAWSVEYDTGHYLDLLSTYSEHLDLEREARERLDAGLAELINTQFGGRVVKQYETVLYVARVADDMSPPPSPSATSPGEPTGEPGEPASGEPAP